MIKAYALFDIYDPFSRHNYVQFKVIYCILYINAVQVHSYLSFRDMDVHVVNI